MAALCKYGFNCKEVKFSLTMFVFSATNEGEKMNMGLK